MHRSARGLPGPARGRRARTDRVFVDAEVVEAHDEIAARVLQNLVVVIEAHAEFACHLVIARVAPFAILDLPHRVGELPRLAMHRARRPVVAADLFELRAADADAGVGLEARTLTRIIIARRLEQTDHAGLD